MEDLIAAGGDPEGAGPALERFREAGGRVPDSEDGRRLLAAMLSSGSYLRDLLLPDPGQLDRLIADPWLRKRKPRERLVRELDLAAAGVGDLTGLQRTLRRFARSEMLRLGAREIGWGTTLEVAAELSALADASLELAVALCDRELRSGFGEPTSGERTPSFVVLGMGKLGGEELNFSSDVDLVYLYSTDEGAAGTLSLHEYYARLSQMVTRALGEPTENGMVFRVDLRLRPEGRGGAICNALAAAERYYETFGRTWERQALLRARPSAGDRGLGEEFLRLVEPFVYPRSIGPHAVDEVLALRRLFRNQAGEGEGFDVKLGAGGIRDVELVAQLLQLLHAGKRADLRERGTLRALHKLTLAGLLSDREQRALAENYQFLRRVEHRIQLEHGSQTHSLPADPAGLERMGRRLGYPGGPEFVADLERRCAVVRAISDTLGEPVSAPPAAVLRLLDPASSRERIEAELREAGFHDVPGSADALEQVQNRLPAAWLTEILASPDPDRALGHFRDLALRGSVGLYTLLRENPPLLRMLASLFGTSDRLSRHLLSHPALWQPLLADLGLPRPDPGTWRAVLPARLAGKDEEEALREMRRYQSEEILRIGVHDVAGNLDGPEVTTQLTALAEVCLEAAVRQVAHRLAERHGAPRAELAVLALGSFGARETRYGSDLDLVFLFSHPGTTEKGMDHQEWFARLAQRLIGTLGALLDEGRLYEVDTRLRPSGQQGLLVTTYASFDRYHHEDAAPWERVALLRARPVFRARFAEETDEQKETGPAPDLTALLEQATYERPIDLDQLRSDLRRMRDRIEKERVRPGPGVIHLRFSPGGLTDLEFLSAFEQLRRGRDDRGLRTAVPYLALSTLVERGLVPEGEALLDDYRFLQRASLRLRLLRDEPDDRLDPRDHAPLARSLDLSQEALLEELRTRMARIRQVWNQALG
jgi:[glutamine synthetase] adenylyltransferase / [glutamine synthetase]-adenylyl-L-tyrosine phosphorylase